MGCILAELYLGYPIFPGENEQEQMLMFMEALGVPPDSLIETGSRSHKFFDGSLVRIKPNSKGKIRRPGSKTL
jgi:dual specificity tyrosine-phosphorylation-regulated kinase 2/3/4